MNLAWRDYTHFPYERELGIREAKSLLNGSVRGVADSGIRLSPTSIDAEAVKRLTYFAGALRAGECIETDQLRLESVAGKRVRRQATRYSVHGLHEYKGKFNPQICRVLLNIFNVRPGQLVLDPFCGSGTALVEAAHLGVRSVGVDINPLAVFVANAKLQSLGIPAGELEESLVALRRTRARTKSVALSKADARARYLSEWFEPIHLRAIETARDAISRIAPSHRAFFLTIASNLLRDYSLQDPSDLRIRRRATAGTMPPFFSAFLQAAGVEISKLAAAQSVIGLKSKLGEARLNDNRNSSLKLTSPKADAAITSPPYATALPYIDTQRLSLVWLNLVRPEQLKALEAELTGSREMDGATRRLLPDRLNGNEDRLPARQLRFCKSLQAALGSGDGFRRKAMPVLLYRYFVSMRGMFSTVERAVKPGAPYALIVGHNHTTLGGERIDIDTPAHLSQLAESTGWTIEEVTPLQTYRQFGLHAANAVESETLLVLRKSPRRRKVTR